MTIPFGQTSIEQQRNMGDGEHSIIRSKLDTVGDGTGTKTIVGTADTYHLIPSATEVFVIDEIILTLADDAVLLEDGFCGLSALTNGCLLRVLRQDGASPAVVVHDFTDGVAITANGDLFHLGNVDVVNLTAGCIISVKMNLKDFGGPIRVDGSRGESLVFETQDDLSGLVYGYVTAIGHHCKKN